MKNLLLLPLLSVLLAPLPGVAQSSSKPAQAHKLTPKKITKGWVVSGLVRDQDNNQPLPGVTVLVKGTSLGTTSDAQGRYSIMVPNAAKAVLLFNFIGFMPVERKVGTAHTLDVTLKPDNQQLNEVVVTGYGTQKRQSVTGSASSVLDGRAAGVAVTSQPISTSQPIRVRGISRVGNSKRKSNPSAPSSVATDYESPSTTQAAPMPLLPAQNEAGAGDTYAKIKENSFLDAKKEPLSTFALDVDGASYTNVRRFLNEGQLPPRDAVRVEEMLNYFTYHYAAPATTSPDPVHISTELTACPWNAGHQLARIGVQARRVETASLPPANLVFLVDVSGSMQEPDRLPLVRSGLKLLVRQLRPQDKVSLVVYAGAAGLVLPPTPGSQPQVITDAIDRLEAGGSTAGGAGLRLAYSVATQNFQKEGNNRVILCSDGDFNVGESSTEAMEQLITTQRETGIFLSVLGVGRGNLRDSQMELLADKGNGNYSYLDNLDEARRVLVAQFGGTLFTVAKDVKLQVEFNPALVKHYRLVGYENRALAAEDFNNDRKDAGELGSGHTVTALYEIEPMNSPTPLIDHLKYQTATPQWPANGSASASASAELLTVKLRYKTPQGLVSKLLSQPLSNVALPLANASADLRFAAAVAEFGMLLRQSEQRGTATYAQAVQLAKDARGDDADGYRAELVRLIQLAQGLSPAAGQALGVR